MWLFNSLMAYGKTYFDTVFVICCNIICQKAAVWAGWGSGRWGLLWLKPLCWINVLKKGKITYNCLLGSLFCKLQVFVIKIGAVFKPVGNTSCQAAIYSVGVKKKSEDFGFRQDLLRHLRLQRLEKHTGLWRYSYTTMGAVAHLWGWCLF